MYKLKGRIKAVNQTVQVSDKFAKPDVVEAMLNEKITLTL